MSIPATDLRTQHHGKCFFLNLSTLPSNLVWWYGVVRVFLMPSSWHIWLNNWLSYWAPWSEWMVCGMPSTTCRELNCDHKDSVLWSRYWSLRIQVIYWTIPNPSPVWSVHHCRVSYADSVSVSSFLKCATSYFDVWFNSHCLQGMHSDIGYRGDAQSLCRKHSRSPASVLLAPFLKSLTASARTRSQCALKTASISFLVTQHCLSALVKVRLA